MFNQTFNIADLPVIGMLVVLEGVLSIDNALVLGLLAKRLPKHLQKRALTYGLIGAFVFRVIAIATATLLMRIMWIKLLGGLYLAYVSLKHFVFESGEKHEEGVAVGADGRPVLVDQQTGQPLSQEQEDHELRQRMQPAHAVPGSRGGITAHSWLFWSTVGVIEMTDIAFAVDSILAAVGMVGSRVDKTWVVITGGFLGVILMRFAAVLFIRMLDRFPRFETAAYLLVLVIGAKLTLDYFFNADHDHPLLDFHSPRHWVFWVFWLTMLACFCVGFVPKRARQTGPAGSAAEPRREQDTISH